ncbi:MAG TPA: hypothetical protein PLM25_03990 [Limnochordia bacterium]|nr:hypothetical protein [Limnochordia bacterium]
MDELVRILQVHQQRYPELTMVDFVKLIYQNEFGPGHLISDEQASLARLEEEYSRLKPRSVQEELFEPIGNGLVRLHLRALEDALPLNTVNRFFVLTARKVRGTRDRFEDKLRLLRESVQGDESLDLFLEEYKRAGYPPLSHSAQFRAAYAPAYRVVLSVFALFFPVFREIERLLRGEQPVVVAIDGRSGSGKSTLAELLQEVYGCSVISMDHFFLRPEQRTGARLREPGGNVDYERFLEEVAVHLRSGQPFRYRILNCRDWSFQPSPVVQPGSLTIVEGCYSHHPAFAQLFDLKVFLTVSPEAQRERILQRSGQAMLQRFVQEWIPLEELYFSSLHIEKQSQVRICTSSGEFA